MNSTRSRTLAGKVVPTASTPQNSPVSKFTKARPLAERLGISPRTIFRWADAGLIHRHKINERVVLFDEKEVVTFVESTRV